MTEEHYKFHLLGAVGDGVQSKSAEDLFYNWSVVHTSLMLGTAAPVLNFARYSQNYANPALPNDARLVNRHADIQYRIMADHWCKTWENVLGSMMDPSHGQRMGRHHFGDYKALRMFFGKGGPIYRSSDFTHPAALTVAHWLASKAGKPRSEAVAQLRIHSKLMGAKLQDFGRPVKYTLDVCDDDMVRLTEASSMKSLPWRQFFAVEWLHFANTHDALKFTEKYGAELKESYSAFIETATSHSIYAVERIVWDFTDDNPSTKTPLPRFFTDKESLEYKMMNGDWSYPSKAFEMLNGTKWSEHTNDSDREQKAPAKALTKDTF